MGSISSERGTIITSVLRFTPGSVVVPGDRLGTTRHGVRPGIGTYVKGINIFCSLVGTLSLAVYDTSNDKDCTNNDATDTCPTYVCSVDISKTSSSSTCKLPAASQVLNVSQLIVGRVKRITAQNALVEIRIAEGVGPLRGPPYYEGAIRLDDVGRSSGKAVVAQTSVADCFRPGDLVNARVISMGDSRRYFLSTAETELGVVRSERNGVVMIPISFNEMECPQTGVREPRKCAKPPTQPATLHEE